MSDLIARLVVTVVLIGAALTMLILRIQETAAVGLLTLAGGFWFGQFVPSPSSASYIGGTDV